MQSQTVSPKPKIAVLGAGLLGRMLTISLMDDYEVSLFDKDQGDAKQSAAYLAAAMLAPLAESADCDLEIMQLGEQALPLWQTFIQRLSLPVFFQQAGSLIVAFDQDLAALKQFQSRLKGDGYSELDLQQIHDLEPELNSRLKKGLFLPNEAQLDNRQLLTAMAAEIHKHHVDWHFNAMVKVFGDEVYVNDVLLDGYDWVIDCRGIGLKADDSQSNHKQSNSKHFKKRLRGVRGEVIRVSAPDVTLRRPVRLMHPRYPIYIAPKENHQFVIGATQIESEDERKPTVRSALELLSTCFSVHSGFAEAEILSIDAGLRPAYIDNHPHIFQQGNRIIANGLFRHGYLLAPIVVQQCLNLIQKQQRVELPLSAVS
ncbi:FAD-dependent oxidoreductase [Thiomicrorhabdus sp.]|uniref:FAD-dependent oxidoreductase n=1 Tax=Thiomicrorhabdus sp. TaxID=2039724 RepID=UPI002AA7C0BA|nr:FAD-dependent oxidoreductase [Thiomicrorhabdus sp.]